MSALNSKRIKHGNREEAPVDRRLEDLKTHIDRLNFSLAEYVELNGEVRARKLDWGTLSVLAEVEPGVAHALNRKEEWKVNAPVGPLAEVLLALVYVCRDKAKLADDVEAMKAADEKRAKAARKLLLRGGTGDQIPRPDLATTLPPEPKPQPLNLDEGRYRKLVAAIDKAGFSVMETSGEWSLHGVRLNDLEREVSDFKRVNDALQVENEKIGSHVLRLERTNESLRRGNADYDAALKAERAKHPPEPVGCEKCRDCPCGGTHVSSDCFCTEPLSAEFLEKTTQLVALPSTPAEKAVSLLGRIKQIAAECGDSFMEIIEAMEEGGAL